MDVKVAFIVQQRVGKRSSVETLSSRRCDVAWYCRQDDSNGCRVCIDFMSSAVDHDLIASSEHVLRCRRQC